MNKWMIVMALCGVALGSCGTKMTRVEYSGEDISGQVSILRNKETKAASIRINRNEEWTLYAGPTVEKIDFSKPVASGKQSGTFPLNVPDSVRSYFQLVTPTARAILAETHLPMTGGYNFRDLGGLKTTDGRYVKWGKILRSDDLHHLTPADLRYLASIPLKTIVDFRADDEIARAADLLPASVEGHYIYSIMPGNLAEAAADTASLTEARADELMQELNRLMVTDPEVIAQYRKFFALLQDTTKTPLMFHCSAGKDRTGMGAALVLFSLGVDEETILQNYLESNDYLADKYAPLIAGNPAMATLFQVKPEFLGAGLEQIRKDHGSVENYLNEVLQVDIPKMRAMYLH